MIFTPKDAIRAKIFALDPVRPIDRVTRIDTRRGVLEQVVEPIRVDDWGDLVCVERKFSAIWPIFDGSSRGPVLFHCYGELLS